MRSQAVWILAYYDVSEDLLLHRCKDADENDANDIHPTEVTEWKCLDDDAEFYTRDDAVETTCNCPTIPSSCSDGDSFYLDVLGYTWDDLGTLDGCYGDSGYTENFLPEYFRYGDKVDDQPVVLASDEFGSTVSKVCLNVRNRPSTFCTTISSALPY